MWPFAWRRVCGITPSLNPPNTHAKKLFAKIFKAPRHCATHRDGVFSLEAVRSRAIRRAPILSRSFAASRPLTITNTYYAPVDVDRPVPRDNARVDGTSVGEHDLFVIEPNANLNVPTIIAALKTGSVY